MNTNSRITRTNHKKIIDLLRFSPEPFIYIDDALAHRILIDNFDELIRRIEKALDQQNAVVTSESEVDQKQVFSQDGVPGDLRVMSFFNNKGGTVKIIGTNEVESVVSDKISVGKCLVIHPQDHFVMCIIDACALSSIRTAAGVLVACKRLGPSSVSTLGVIGCGRIGFYTVIAFQRAGLIDECLCFDISRKSMENFSKLVSLEHGPRFRICETEEIFRQSKSVALATTSAKPVIGLRDIIDRPVEFISSVGADANNLSELDENLLPAVHIVSGSHHCLEMGDMKRWIERGIITRSDIRFLSNTTREDFQVDGRPRCYISTGFPLLDHVAAALVYEVAREENLGEKVQFANNDERLLSSSPAAFKGKNQ